VEVVEHNLLHLLVNLLLLAENDVALALYGARLELRVLEDVGDDVHGLADVLAERLGVVDRLLPARVRVQVRAEVLDLQLKRVLRALAGALEGHVLEEVGSAVRLVRLRTRASVDPDTDGRGLRRGVRLGRDGEAVREGGDFGGRAGHARRGRERAQSALWNVINDELASHATKARTALRALRADERRPRRREADSMAVGLDRFSAPSRQGWCARSRAGKAFGREPGRGRGYTPVC
jgi:hypothetical protein